MDRYTSLAWELAGRYFEAGERVRAAATCRGVASAMAATGISAPLGPCRELPAVNVETPACFDREIRSIFAGCAYVVRLGLADMVEDDPTHEECGGWCERERYEDMRELVLELPPPRGVSIEFRTSCPIGPLETLSYGVGPTFVSESLDLAAPDPADRDLFEWESEWGGGYTDVGAWHYRVDTRNPRGPCVEASVDVGAARLSISFGGCEDHPDVRWMCPSFEASFGRYEDKWAIGVGEPWSEELDAAWRYENCVRNGKGGPWRWRATDVDTACREIDAWMAQRYSSTGPCTRPVAERARDIALFARNIETLKRMLDEAPEECRGRLSRIPLVDESSVEYSGHGDDFYFFDSRVFGKLKKRV